MRRSRVTIATGADEVGEVHPFKHRLRAHSGIHGHVHQPRRAGVAANHVARIEVVFLHREERGHDGHRDDVFKHRRKFVPLPRRQVIRDGNDPVLNGRHLLRPITQSCATVVAALKPASHALPRVNLTINSCLNFFFHSEDLV